MAGIRRYTPDPAGESPAGDGNSGGRRSVRPTTGAGVRYGLMNWIGEFRLPHRTSIKRGAKVVIQSDRGIEIGQQVSLVCPGCEHSVGRDQIKKYVSSCGPEFYRFRVGKILREASPQDIDEHKHLNRDIRDDIDRCEQAASELKLDLKVITAEHLLGGERIVFYFRSEGRIDFRELVRELAGYYQTRIEMRQIGARDEARLIADYEVCGRECCCKSFLKRLRPVTMRMAKLQKSTLDPSKVSGRCGRLRCCLRYEHDGYDELLRKLPRIGTRVQSEIGPATVVDRQVLTQLVLLRGDDERKIAVPVEEISPLKATPPAPTPKPVSKPDSPVDSNAEQRAGTEREKPGRRRRRPRRPPTDKPPETATSADSPTASPNNRAAEKPASESGKSDREDPPKRRRRRRRRRPRGNQPDAPPGSDGS